MIEESMKNKINESDDLSDDFLKDRLKKAHGEALGEAVWDTVKSFRKEMNEMTSTSQERIKKLIIDSEDRIQSAEQKIVNEVKIRFIPMALVIVVSVLAGVIWYFYSGTKDVNNSVISLQKDILSAQNVIRESLNELQQAKSDMNEAQNQLNTIISDYQKAEENYNNLTDELETMINEYNIAKDNYNSLAEEAGIILEKLQQQSDNKSP